jgi:hypothetical protein
MDGTRPVCQQSVQTEWCKREKIVGELVQTKIEEEEEEDEATTNPQFQGRE